MDKFFNKQRFFRRLVLVWSLSILSFWVWFIADHQFLISVGAAGATIVTGVIGILATVIGFYQWHRTADDGLRNEKSDTK